MRSQYTSNGSSKRFSINWPYLDRAHVFCTVDGTPWGFTWLSDSEVELAGALPSNKTVVIQRVTPLTDGLAQFQDGVKVTAADLNKARLQVLYALQEATASTSTNKWTEIAAALNASAQNLTEIAQARSDVLAAKAVLDQGVTDLNNLNIGLSRVEASGQTTREMILQEIQDRKNGDDGIKYRLDTVELAQTNFGAQVSNEAYVRANADGALSARIDTVQSDLTAADTRLTSAVQSEALSRANADNALASAVENIRADITGPGGAIQAAVSAEATARVNADNALSGRVSTAESNYTLKTTARSDGKVAMAGIGLISTATGSTTQSEIIFQADQFRFVPGTNINGPLTSLMALGTVNGTNTLVLNSSTFGDQSIGARMIVDGVIEARHVKVNGLTADRIDTRGLLIRDANGNVIFGAGTNLTSAYITPASNWLNSNVSIAADGTLNGAGGGKVTITGLGYTGALDATRNSVTYGTTAPSSPVNGDIWVDTSVTPNVTRVRVSGAWQVSANLTTNTNQLTDGAGLGTTATWSGVTGTGKPADNATRNIVSRQATAPSGPFNGDVWVDTSVNPNVTRVYVSGSWQIAANLTTDTNQLTDGAGLGTKAVWSNVTGAGKPQDNATVGATIGVNLQGKITADNATTFIDTGAITNALIGNLIQSANYVPGSTGWSLNKNGDIELNNATVRGNITANAVTANSITTSSLVTDAASSRLGAFSSTAQSLPRGSWAAVLSATFTSTGAPMTITAGSVFRSLATAPLGTSAFDTTVTMDMRLVTGDGRTLFNSRVLDEWLNSSTRRRAGSVFTMPPLIDSPPAGTHTYTLEILFNSGNSNVTGTAAERGIHIIENKR